MLSTFLLLLTYVGLLYAHLVRHYRYWSKRGVPGPEPFPLLGNFPRSFWWLENVSTDLQKVYCEFKGRSPFVGIYFNRSPMLLVIDPATVRQVLTTNFQQFHDSEFGPCVREYSWYEICYLLIIFNLRYN